MFLGTETNQYLDIARTDEQTGRQRKAHRRGRSSNSAIVALGTVTNRTHIFAMSASEGPLEVVISYAHRDQALKDELIVHLSPLRRQGIIADWHDRDIDAGDDWKREIDIRLNAAGMILLIDKPRFYRFRLLLRN
jgi:hypothetical protein